MNWTAAAAAGNGAVPSQPGPTWGTAPRPDHTTPIRVLPEQAAPGYAVPGRAAPVQPVPSYPAPSYPAPSYPAPSYPVPGHGGASYPAPGHAAAGQSVPGQGWQHRGPGAPAPRVDGAGPVRTKPLPTQRTKTGWAMLGLLGLGLILLLCGLAMLGDELTVTPTSPYALATAVVLFGAHGVVLYLVVRWLDFPVRRSVLLLVLAVAWGGLVSTSLSLTVETWVGGFLSLFEPSPSTAIWLGATLVGITEESAKLLGVLAIVLVAPRLLSRATDGLIYGALVGLGFEEIENVVYAVRATNTSHFGDSVVPVIVQFLLRGLVAGWGLHIVWSALTGAGIAWAYLNRDKSKGTRITVAALAFAVAGLCHMLWDSALADWVVALGPLFLIAVVVAPLALIIAVALRGQGGVAVQRLARCSDPAVATPAELVALSSPYRRFGARWNGYVRGGFGAARAVGRLHQGQATLAMLLLSGDTTRPAADRPVPGHLTGPQPLPGPARPGAGPADGTAPKDELSVAHAAIQTARRQLHAAGLPEAAGPDDLYRGPAGIGWAALGAGFTGLVGMQVVLALSGGAWSAGSLLLVALLILALGGATLVLCAREVRLARAGRRAADTRVGMATLPGLTSVLLGVVLLTVVLGVLAL
ncbi:MAG TPA: PrsW family glutamic-type intramembrane protease [Pseudonocardia sp.]|nr:PrsW family glutamic-type intramembrane protease [Pseudonocardia sp.]